VPNRWKIGHKKGIIVVSVINNNKLIIVSWFKINQEARKFNKIVEETGFQGKQWNLEKSLEIENKQNYQIHQSQPTEVTFDPINPLMATPAKTG